MEPTPTLIAARALAGRRARQPAASPAELARRLDPNYRVTPTIRLLSDLAVRAVTEPDRRDIVSTPPRTGKSRLLAVWTTVWALSRDPDMQIVLVSYNDALAQAHSRDARQLISEHSEFLGIRISQDKTSVGRWRVDGHEGGLLAAGILSGITGFGADLLILDDVLKNAQEADSAAHRRRVLNEYRSTLATRVHPDGSTLLVGTRWHEADLIGSLLGDEPATWCHTNIPAVAETGIPDALGRDQGVAMVSALGRTAESFADLRRSVGSRSWYALFQGVPSSPEGGLIKRDWLDAWRLPAAPLGPIKTVVGVDPSDSGSGDSCGLVAASVGRDGVVALIADISEPLTAEQWARRAVALAVETGASEIAVETFSAGTTYLAVVADAIRRMRPERAIRVTAWPPKGSGRGRGDAEARSAGLRQALEVGTCRIAGHLPLFEEQAVTWQSGQHQPDGVAAATIAHDVLVNSLGQQVTFTNPATIEARMRERRPVEEFGGRFGSRGPIRPTPLYSHLSRRISSGAGGGYDPLAAPRKTIRGL